MRGRAVWLLLVAMVACTPSIPPDVDTRRVRGSAPPTSSSDTPVPEGETSEVPGPVADEADSPAPGEVPDRWTYPDLDLVAALDERGGVLVGPRGFAQSGCGRLDADVDGTTVVVRGMRYPGGPVSCTANTPPRWVAVPTQDQMTLTITYRAHTGSYAVNEGDGLLTMHLLEGQDTAPPLSSRWWRVPSDFRSLHASAAGDGPAFCRRVEERLRREGATRFEASEGQPLLRFDDREAPAIRSEERSWYFDAQEGDRCRRSIRISASDDRLQKIAEEETARQPCSSIAIWRTPHQSPKVRAQGDHSRCLPPPTPQPTPLI